MILTKDIHHAATVTANIGDDTVRPVVDESQRDRVGIDSDTPMLGGCNNLAIHMRQQTLRGGIDIAIDKDVFRLFIQFQSSQCSA